MKNKLYSLFLFAFVLLLGFASDVNAAEIKVEDVPKKTYIIGTHMIEAEEVNLTTQHIMLAAKTIEGNKLEDMVIYYKSARGGWTDELTGEEIEVPATFEVEKINGQTMLDNVEITSKAFDGTSVDNEVVYKLLTDKEVGDGVEIYSADTIDGEYTLINTTDGYENIRVNVLQNTKKYIKVRPYKVESEDRVYGVLSEAIEIDQTYMSEKANISNIEFGVVDTNTITLSINEEVGDGFIIYSSDSKDGEYKYEYDFEYTSEQFSNNKVNFTLRNEATGTTKYFKIRAFKDNDTTRVYSELSNAYGIILQDIEVTGKTFDGTSADNEVVYKLLTDKEVGDGVEIYSADTIDGEYTLINTTTGYDFIRVSVLQNTKKFIKIRGYQGSSSEDRVYGGFSTPIEIDQTYISENAEISNVDFGAVDTNTITLSINEEVGDGFIIYSSDSKDGEYKYEYDFEYTSEQFSNNKVNFTLRNEATGTTKYFKIRAFKDNDTTRVYSELSNAYGIILQDIEVTGKTFDGTSADNEVVYKLLTDKEVGDGVEIYSADTIDGEYTLINTTTGYDFIRVSVLDNTKKFIKIRGYQGSSSEDRVYGGFSTPIEIDQTNISENIEISNIEYGVVDENIITLTINEEVGDGFIIYSSDTIDGEYKYEYDFEYTSEQFSNNKVNFTLRNEATGTTKYFKIKAFKDNDTTRVYSALSSASELSL